jgi:hypothetical protein
VRNSRETRPFAVSASVDEPSGSTPETTGATEPAGRGVDPGPAPRGACGERSPPNTDPNADRMAPARLTSGNANEEGPEPDNSPNRPLRPARANLPGWR